MIWNPTCNFTRNASNPLSHLNIYDPLIVGIKRDLNMMLMTEFLLSLKGFPIYFSMTVLIFGDIPL